MAIIKGTTVTLYERTEAGTDEFGAMVYEETAVDVENVLVSPSSAEDVIQDLQLYGRRSVYELSIPKDDEHSWENQRVEFFGQVFRTFGAVSEYIEAMVPLEWNRKVKVERYE